VRRREGALVGLFALAGAGIGVVIANTLSGAALRTAFAALLLIVAGKLVYDSLRAPKAPG
jgi:uncharacterized membrane protein YfcA